MKAPKAVNPTTTAEKAELIQNFERARNDLKSLCNTHTAARFKNLIFKHPFLGDIDGVATISFIGYHERRHHKQIDEVLKKLGR